MKTRKRTFKYSMDFFFLNLGLTGWDRSSPHIKVRWAEKDGIRIWFKARSVYVGKSDSVSRAELLRGACISDAKPANGTIGIGADGKTPSDLRELSMGQFMDLIGVSY